MSKKGDGGKGKGFGKMNVPQEMCKFGAKCSRQSDDHKLRYCHPGDNNYDDQIDASGSGYVRPDCFYGSKCYRVNEDHRKKFYHPDEDDNLKKPVWRGASPDFMKKFNGKKMDGLKIEIDLTTIPNTIKDADEEYDGFI